MIIIVIWLTGWVLTSMIIADQTERDKNLKAKDNPAWEIWFAALFAWPVILPFALLKVVLH